MNARNRTPLAFALLIASLLAAAPSAARAVTCVWAVAQGDWTNTANWRSGIAPGEGDDVWITNGTVTLSCTTSNLNSLVISNTAQLSFTNWSTILFATNVSILGTSRVQTPAAFTTNQMSNRVQIVCGNLTLGSAAMITVDAKGYAGGATNLPGQGRGGGSSTTGYGGGGGYGGRGGASQNGAASGGGIYGTSTNPVDAGSSGGGAMNGSGGSGGGDVRIVASGSVMVNGTISANGGTGSSGYAGGGAGGSIWILCDTLMGNSSGALRANGVGMGTGALGGGGGGGRIAVARVYDFYSGTYSASNGAGGSASSPAQSGTVSRILIPPTYSCSLEVTSPHGYPNPPVGTNWFIYGTWITNYMMGSPIFDGMQGTQRVCAGWTGWGFSPDTGTGTNIPPFALTNYAWLAWLWETNYYLSVEAGKAGSVDVTSGWYAAQASLTLHASPKPDCEFAGWTGDVLLSNRMVNPLGVIMTGPLRIQASFNRTVSNTHYVSPAGAHLWPFTNWVDAATNIQAAVDAATTGETVLVMDGVYDTGGASISNAMNRITVTGTVAVLSVNGAERTAIVGQGPPGDDAVRCAYLAAGASLSGFTLTTGATRAAGDVVAELSGGGAWCESGAVLSRCVVSGNTAVERGGGVYGGTVRSCLIAGNSAGEGGGAFAEELENCTICGNAASNAGGAFLPAGSAIANTILYFNSSVTADSNWCGVAEGLASAYCCSVPALPDADSRSDDPMFMCADCGDYRLQYGSPCIDGGTNQAWMEGANDLGGVLRIVDGRTDIGAYEYGFMKRLIVETPHGTPAPPAGLNTYEVGSTVSCAMEDSIEYDGVDATQYVCTGWTGLGSVPASGDGTRAPSFVIASDSTITWNWTTYYYLKLGAKGLGTVYMSNAWCEAGSTVTLYAMAAPGYRFDRWVGDIDAADAATYSPNVVMDRARHIEASFVLNSANVHYVSPDGGNRPPFTNWTDAATTIQDAISVCSNNHTVLVMDGVYASSGASVYSCMNRVALTNRITVASVNGAERTFIVGQGPLGDDAVRCAYVGSNACLRGFTLTGGFTKASGDQYKEQSGGGVWGETYGTVANCLIAGCTASLNGGGTYGGTVSNCTVSGNYAWSCGGGVCDGTVYASTIVSNQAGMGGGVSAVHPAASRIYGSTIMYNQAGMGGGAGSQGYPCAVVLQSCFVSHNRASSQGGGLWAYPPYGIQAMGCTVVGNAAQQGGGAYWGILVNSIVYYNTAMADENYVVYGPYGPSDHCCTTPFPGGSSNFTNAPALMSLDNPHIAWNSPCVDAGTNAAGWTDIDGDLRTSGKRTDMGCDEVVAGSTTGALALAINMSYTNVVVNTPLHFEASIRGKPSGTVWSFDDGVTATNVPFLYKTYTATGDFNVTLTASNWSGSTSAWLTVHTIDGFTNYVSFSGLNIPPYTNWATAAWNIQDAVDAAAVGGTVLVGPGTYSSNMYTFSTNVYVLNGMKNRIGLYKPVIVMADNPAPGATVILGQGPLGANAVRCAYVGDGARLSGFTLRGGFTRNDGDAFWQQSGGGVWSEARGVVTNCVIWSNNAAIYGGGMFGGTADGCTLVSNLAIAANTGKGGGTAYVTVRNCTLAGNSASSSGAGAYYGQVQSSRIQGNKGIGGAVYGGGTAYSTVQNSAVVSNTSTYGGGVYYGSAQNCLIYRNTALTDGGGAHYATVQNCTIARNTAFHFGGGTVAGTIQNSIVWNNAATGGTGTNHYNSASNYFRSCTDPLPVGGEGNIVADPSFVNAAGDNYHLGFYSPCIDAGMNAAWMDGATDYDGKPRISNGTVDMGPYEIGFVEQIRVYLQGAYDAARHQMAETLRPNIPRSSPYSADPRTVAAIPAGTVDWVLVELVDTNGNAIVSRSAFLGTDGWVMADDGSMGIPVEAAAGGVYRLSIKHRNHLAVATAAAAAYTNHTMMFDFTSDPGQILGGAGGMAEMETGVWGLVAGDADGDGEVLEVDKLIALTGMGRKGYRRADFNLDGIVSNNELCVLWSNNAGRASAATNAAVLLGQSLSVSPSRRTVLAGESLLFQAAGGTGEVTWAFAKNPGGDGTLSGIDATSVLYQAGGASSNIDIVEAWNSDDLLGRAYVNLISTEDIARAGKAIVIAGRKGPDDPLWPTTDYLADLAYDTLLYRGYSKGNIRYLSPEPAHDADGNGLSDDVYAENTPDNIALTFTNWVGNDTSKLFIYLVDHGGDSAGAGYFRLSATNTLTAAQLDAWLDALQDTYGTEVTILIDCCYSGSFVDELAYGGTAQRIVITACNGQQPTYFVAGGFVSFSESFFCGVMLGLDIESCYAMALGAMSSYQEPMQSGGSMSGLFVGSSFVAGKDIPQIGHVSGDQALCGDAIATLWAGDIASVYPIDRVWCLIVQPGLDPDPANPVANMPEVTLTYNPTTGRYEATRSGFSGKGIYKTIYYARDVWGSVSQPRQSTITQNGVDECAVLALGGPTNDARWAAAANLARVAYRTLRGRWFSPNRIYCLSACTNQDLNGDGTNDIDAAIGLNTFANAVTNWASGSGKLTAFLIGFGTNDALQLNEDECLVASDLDLWLDTYQQSNADACVVMDFSGAGGFLAEQSPPAGARRITIAGAAAGKPACWGNEGLVSFTQYFMSDVFEGASVWDAFVHARKAVKRATGFRQRPELDDTGDGRADKADGALARDWHIGTVFLTGDDAPEMSGTTPDSVLDHTNALVLWASGVTDMAGISNVWCVVTPPDYDGQGNLPEVPLTWNGERKRYEAQYDDFSQAGNYAVTFLARNGAGKISSPLQRSVIKPDEYEPDDSTETASVYAPGVFQLHNFHVAGDVDWVKFYMTTGMLYEVEAEQGGTNSDLKIDVFSEQPDGTLSNIDWLTADEYGKGEEEMESTAVETEPEFGVSPGTYYIRISSADPTAYGAGSDYQLRVFLPVGADQLIVVAADKLDANHSPPGATAIVDGSRSASFNSATSVSFAKLSAGGHTVRVPIPDGYIPEESATQPNQVANPSSAWYGNPKTVDASCQIVVFQFVPYVRADGLVRDAWTGQRLAGSYLSFTARNGPTPGQVYDGYPGTASYRTTWYSRADGSFPTNVVLLAVDWDLKLTAAGYADRVWTPRVVNAVKGSVTNLGTLYLTPRDTNNNGLADSWEEIYFQGKSGVTKTNDADKDGLNNWQEYLCGTDPTNEHSVLAAEPPAVETNGFTLSWPVVGGHTYRVLLTDSLTTDTWPLAYGPWEPTNGQTRMRWTDTNALARTNRFYRVELLGP